jgi:peptidoglycan/LPS O-acetylase OafA/YrhL
VSAASIGPARRIPSLDGIRGVGTILVLLAHLVGTRSFVSVEHGAVLMAIGALGVRAFFVISGFLITGLLLTELRERGRIRLGRFYLRRTLKIFPPLYVFILGLILLQVVGFVTLNDGDVVGALTYTSNYRPHRSWFVGHTWSLSVEEQFYLLWPVGLLLAGRRRSLAAAGILVIACPAVRLLTWVLFPQLREGVGHRFETVADTIAIGCVLAGAREWLWAQRSYVRLMGSRWFALVPLLALAAACTLHDRPRLDLFIGFSVQNVALALCIDWSVAHHAGRIGTVLNARPLSTLGLMSYSVYLWQQVFLARGSSGAAASFPLNLVLVAIAGSLTYRAVEQPAVRLRRRMEAWIFTDGGWPPPAPSSVPLPDAARP